MLDRDQILRLIPHQGRMCLLDQVRAWSAQHICCRAKSHLDPTNPLLRRGRLSTVRGLEYGLQAAALHGALLAGAAAPLGMLASLRGVIIHRTRLDDPAIGDLHVAARLEHGDTAAQAYRFHLRDHAGELLAEGRAIIALRHS